MQNIYLFILKIDTELRDKIGKYERFFRNFYQKQSGKKLI